MARLIDSVDGAGSTPSDAMMTDTPSGALSLRRRLDSSAISASHRSDPAGSGTSLASPGMTSLTSSPLSASYVTKLYSVSPIHESTSLVRPYAANTASSPLTERVWVPSNALSAELSMTVTGASPVVSPAAATSSGDAKMVCWATPQPMSTRASTKLTIARTNRTKSLLSRCPPPPQAAARAWNEWRLGAPAEAEMAATKTFKITGRTTGKSLGGRCNTRLSSVQARDCLCSKLGVPVYTRRVRRSDEEHVNGSRRDRFRDRTARVQEG